MRIFFIASPYPGIAYDRFQILRGSKQPPDSGGSQRSPLSVSVVAFKINEGMDVLVTREVSNEEFLVQNFE